MSDWGLPSPKDQLLAILNASKANDKVLLYDSLESLCTCLVMGMEDYLRAFATETDTRLGQLMSLVPSEEALLAMIKEREARQHGHGRSGGDGGGGGKDGEPSTASSSPSPSSPLSTSLVLKSGDCLIVLLRCIANVLEHVPYAGTALERPSTSSSASLWGGNASSNKNSGGSGSSSSNKSGCSTLMTHILALLSYCFVFGGNNNDATTVDSASSSSAVASAYCITGYQQGNVLLLADEALKVLGFIALEDGNNVTYLHGLLPRVLLLLEWGGGADTRLSKRVFQALTFVCQRLTISTSSLPPTTSASIGERKKDALGSDYNDDDGYFYSYYTHHHHHHSTKGSSPVVAKGNGSGRKRLVIVPPSVAFPSPLRDVYAVIIAASNVIHGFYVSLVADSVAVGGGGGGANTIASIASTEWDSIDSAANCIAAILLRLESRGEYSFVAAALMPTRHRCLEEELDAEGDDGDGDGDGEAYYSVSQQRCLIRDIAGLAAAGLPQMPLGGALINVPPPFEDDDDEEDEEDKGSDNDYREGAMTTATRITIASPATPSSSPSSSPSASSFLVSSSSPADDGRRLALLSVIVSLSHCAPSIVRHAFTTTAAVSTTTTPASASSRPFSSPSSLAVVSSPQQAPPPLPPFTAFSHMTQLLRCLLQSPASVADWARNNNTSNTTTASHTNGGNSVGGGGGPNAPASLFLGDAEEVGAPSAAVLALLDDPFGKQSTTTSSATAAANGTAAAANGHGSANGGGGGGASQQQQGTNFTSRELLIASALQLLSHCLPPVPLVAVPTAALPSSSSSSAPTASAPPPSSSSPVANPTANLTASELKKIEKERKEKEKKEKKEREKAEKELAKKEKERKKEEAKLLKKGIVPPSTAATAPTAPQQQQQQGSAAPLMIKSNSSGKSVSLTAPPPAPPAVSIVLSRVWSWEDDLHTFTPYSAAESTALELALLSNRTSKVMVRSGGRNYEVDLTGLKQEREGGGFARNVRRAHVPSSYAVVATGHRYSLLHSQASSVLLFKSSSSPSPLSSAAVGVVGRGRGGGERGGAYALLASEVAAMGFAAREMGALMPSYLGGGGMEGAAPPSPSSSSAANASCLSSSVLPSSPSVFFDSVLTFASFHLPMLAHYCAFSTNSAFKVCALQSLVQTLHWLQAGLLWAVGVEKREREKRQQEDDDEVSSMGLKSSPNPTLNQQKGGGGEGDSAEEVNVAASIIRSIAHLLNTYTTAISEAAAETLATCASILGGGGGAPSSPTTTQQQTQQRYSVVYAFTALDRLLTMAMLFDRRREAKLFFYASQQQQQKTKRGGVMVGGEEEAVVGNNNIRRHGDGSSAHSGALRVVAAIKVSLLRVGLTVDYCLGAEARAGGTLSVGGRLYALMRRTARANLRGGAIANIEKRGVSGRRRSDGEMVPSSIQGKADISGHSDSGASSSLSEEEENEEEEVSQSFIRLSRAAELFIRATGLSYLSIVSSPSSPQSSSHNQQRQQQYLHHRTALLSLFSAVLTESAEISPYEFAQINMADVILNYLNVSSLNNNPSSSPTTAASSPLSSSMPMMTMRSAYFLRAEQDSREKLLIAVLAAMPRAAEALTVLLVGSLPYVSGAVDESYGGGAAPHHHHEHDKSSAHSSPPQNRSASDADIGDDAHQHNTQQQLQHQQQGKQNEGSHPITAFKDFILVESLSTSEDVVCRTVRDAVECLSNISPKLALCVSEHAATSSPADATGGGKDNKTNNDNANCDSDDRNDPVGVYRCARGHFLVPLPNTSHLRSRGDWVCALCELHSTEIAAATSSSSSSSSAPPPAMHCPTCREPFALCEECQDAIDDKKRDDAIGAVRTHLMTTVGDFEAYSCGRKDPNAVLLDGVRDRMKALLRTAHTLRSNNSSGSGSGGSSRRRRGNSSKADDGGDDSDGADADDGGRDDRRVSRGEEAIEARIHALKGPKRASPFKSFLRSPVGTTAAVGNGVGRRGGASPTLAGPSSNTNTVATAAAARGGGKRLVFDVDADDDDDNAVDAKKGRSGGTNGPLSERVAEGDDEGGEALLRLLSTSLHPTRLSLYYEGIGRCAYQDTLIGLLYRKSMSRRLFSLVDVFEDALMKPTEKTMKLRREKHARAVALWEKGARTTATTITTIQNNDYSRDGQSPSSRGLRIEGGRGGGSASGGRAVSSSLPTLPFSVKHRTRRSVFADEDDEGDEAFNDDDNGDDADGNDGRVNTNNGGTSSRPRGASKAPAPLSHSVALNVASYPSLWGKTLFFHYFPSTLAGVDIAFEDNDGNGNGGVGGGGGSRKGSNVDYEDSSRFIGNNDDGGGAPSDRCACASFSFGAFENTNESGGGGGGSSGGSGGGAAAAADSSDDGAPNIQLKPCVVEHYPEIILLQLLFDMTTTTSDVTTDHAPTPTGTPSALFPSSVSPSPSPPSLLNIRRAAFVSKSVTERVIKACAASALRVALLDPCYALPRWVYFVLTECSFLLPPSIVNRIAVFLAYGARRSLWAFIYDERLTASASSSSDTQQSSAHQNSSSSSSEKKRRSGNELRGITLYPCEWIRIPTIGSSSASTLIATAAAVSAAATAGGSGPAATQTTRHTVNRRRLLLDALKVLSHTAELRFPITIAYEGEKGTGNGPTIAFYTDIAKALCRKELGIWRQQQKGEGEEDNTQQQQQSSNDDAHQYVVVGKEGLFPSIAPPSATNTQNNRAVDAVKTDSNPLAAANAKNAGRLHLFHLLGTAMARAFLDKKLFPIALSPLLYDYLRLGLPRRNAKVERSLAMEYRERRRILAMSATSSTPTQKSNGNNARHQQNSPLSPASPVAAFLSPTTSSPLLFSNVSSSRVGGVPSRGFPTPPPPSSPPLPPTMVLWRHPNFSLKALALVDEGLYASLKKIKKELHDVCMAGGGKKAGGGTRAASVATASEAEAEAAAVRRRVAQQHAAELALEALDLPFTLPGRDDIRLCPDASHVSGKDEEEKEKGEMGSMGGDAVVAERTVDADNFTEYLTRVVVTMCYGAVRDEITAFVRGFGDVVPSAALRILSSGRAMAAMVAGDDDINTPLWAPEGAAVTTTASASSSSSFATLLQPDHGYTRDSNVIAWLVSIVTTEFTPRQQRQFLEFCTGCPRAPIGGFGAMGKIRVVCKEPSTNSSSPRGGGGDVATNPSFSSNGDNASFTQEGSLRPISSLAAPTTSAADKTLVSVNTCFLYLKIPQYSSREVMKVKLLQSIYGSEGFDFS